MAGAIAYISRDTDGLAVEQAAGRGARADRLPHARAGLGNTDDIEIALAWKRRARPAGVVPEPQDDRVARHGRRSSAGRRQAARRRADHAHHGRRPGRPDERVRALLGAAPPPRHRQICREPAARRSGSRASSSTPSTAAIGIMGLGAIGQDTARKFAALGFPTAGWSRTPKTLPGVETFHGPSGLPKFLGAAPTSWSNVLPLTRETRGIIDARRCSPRCPRAPS